MSNDFALNVQICFVILRFVYQQIVFPKQERTATIFTIVFLFVFVLPLQLCFETVEQNGCFDCIAFPFIKITHRTHNVANKNVDHAVSALSSIV